jgi:hypothetical protein
LNELQLIQILSINAESAAAALFAREKRAALTGRSRRESALFVIWQPYARCPMTPRRGIDAFWQPWRFTWR